MPDRPGRLVRDSRALDGERIAVWFVVLVVVASVAGTVALFGSEIRNETPDADFAVAFDGETRTITVTHDGGDPIRDRTTERLAVVVVDESGGTSERLTWVSDDAGPSKRGSGYPVSAGDELTIDDPSTDADGDENYHDADATVGFHLDEDDTVRVLWQGTDRTGPVENATLAETTVG